MSYNSTYHIYSNDNNTHVNSGTDNHFSPYEATSPYVQLRKLHHSVIDHIDGNKEESQQLDEKRQSIDFPSSPPPETAHNGLKYSSSYSLGSTSPSNWSEPSKTLNHEIDPVNTTIRKSSPLGMSFVLFE